MCVACGSNEYGSGGDCVACRVTCGSGEYVSGSCGGASDYGCTACNNGAGVGTEYYTGAASTIGMSDCPVSACSACPAGQVIGTACSATSNTMCVACGSNEYESGGDCVACRVTCGSRGVCVWELRGRVGLWVHCVRQWGRSRVRVLHGTSFYDRSIELPGVGLQCVSCGTGHWYCM